MEEFKKGWAEGSIEIRRGLPWAFALVIVSAFGFWIGSGCSVPTDKQILGAAFIAGVSFGLGTVFANSNYSR